MMKFLFSRSHKKHYTSAVVRMGKNNLGFSIIELVIVIAIIAILAAVAIPVFGAFIKKAEKSNDQNVVKDIVYAVDLANKSGAFLEEDSVTFGATKFPIGFIVINDAPDAYGNHTTILTSGTQIVSANTPCEFSEQAVTINYLNPISVERWCGVTKYTQDCYELTQITVQYCKTHTAFDEIVEANEYEYISDFSVSCTPGFMHLSCNSPTYTNVMASVPEGTTNFIEDKNQIFIQSEDGEHCSYAVNYVDQEDAPVYFSGQNIVNANDPNHPLYKTMVDVFGSDFANSLKLSSNEWNVKDGVPTLYTSATEFFDDVQTLGGYLAAASSISQLKDAFGVSGTYSSSEEVVSGFSEAFISVYGNDRGAWLNMWRSIPNDRHDGCGFGLTGRENYSACRIAYNASFAAYLRTWGVEEKYVEVVKTYYSLNGGETFGALSTVASWAGLNLYDVYLPAVVTNESFEEGGVEYNNRGTEIINGGTNKLFTQLCRGSSDATTKAEALAAFNKIWQCYKEYQLSNTFEENANAFYDTMVTIEDTDEDANAYGDYFSFYSTYLNEMSTLYTTALGLAGEGGIVIIVYSENGIATCEVVPADADFRNK